MTRFNLNHWLLAARPRTLTAAVAPVIVGSALAYRDSAFDPGAGLAALLGAVLIQVGANFANDVYDFKKGADANRVGPIRVTTAGLLSAREVEIGMWLAFAAAAVFGLYLIAIGGWPILVIGLLSILAAIAYTAGPFPLGYNGLGDLFTFIFFGLIAVMGTYYVHAGRVTPEAFLASLSMAALITNLLVVNNVRDLDTDRTAGKRTLAVIFGRDAARMEYDFLLGLAYLVPIVFVLAFGFGAWALLPLVSLPLAVRLTRALRSESGPALNRTLAGSAQLAAVYAALFAVGVIL
jgi:1,4-dihydroxy-2-naphthoate octaprenyltransferase